MSLRSLGRAECQEGLSMQAFLIELGDKPGALADVAEAIAAKGVNIASVSVATCGETGRIAIATDDEAATRAALGGIQGTFEQKELTTTLMPNQPGALAKAARQLANKGVNIESAMLMGMKGQDIEIGFVTSDPVVARDALARSGAATG
jgi:hypothetical protein